MGTHTDFKLRRVNSLTFHLCTTPLPHNMSREMVPISIRDPFFKDPFFSSTWEEFDKMRQDMMAKSKDFWGRVDKDFTNFDEQVKKAHQDMDTQMTSFRPQLPTWAIPDTLKTDMTLFRSNSDSEVIKVKEDDGKFEVTLDVSDYKPEELKVTTVNNVLSIEGKHEEQKQDSKESENSSAFGSSSVMKQFSRKWTLPANADPNDVISNLSSDGILMVTAPRKGAIKNDVTIQKAIK